VTELVRGLNNIKSKHQQAVMTIGNFDGVHLGHKALIDSIKKSAQALNTVSLIMVFEPQPQEFFSANNPVPRLTRFREKCDALMQMGIDYLLVQPFNATFAAVTADDFIGLLKNRLNIKKIIVGEDFKFGQKRAGDVELLKRKSEEGYFNLELMPVLTVLGQRVSSTRIRAALKAADLQLAEVLLGRPYTMMGRIVYGNQLGRTLGFPTANIYLHRLQTAVEGIYIVRLHGINKKGLPGVANIGIRPTIGGTRTLLEVYLFNFNQSIYGKYVKVEFCEKLRDEICFDNLTLLQQAMEQDARAAEAYFVARGELS